MQIRHEEIPPEQIGISRGIAEQKTNPPSQHVLIKSSLNYVMNDVAQQNQ